MICSVLRGAPAGISAACAVWIDDLADSISFLSIILTEKVSSTSLSETRLAVRRDRARAGVCEDLRLARTNRISVHARARSHHESTPRRDSEFSDSAVTSCGGRASERRARGHTVPLRSHSDQWTGRGRRQVDTPRPPLSMCVSLPDLRAAASITIRLGS